MPNLFYLPMSLLPHLFASPVYRGPGGGYDWRVRWVPLVVWVCLLNAVLFALIVYFQPPDEPVERVPVSGHTDRSRTFDKT